MPSKCFITPTMYFRVNLKMKKPTLYCCFTWIVFIELNFTVAFLLIEETCDDRCAVKVWGWGDFKKWGDTSNEGDDFELGDLFTDYERVMWF